MKVTICALSMLMMTYTKFELFGSCSHQFVMKNLVVMGSVLLDPMDFYDNEVTELEEKVRKVLIGATVPLRAYAAEYEKHLDLHNLDIKTFK